MKVWKVCLFLLVILALQEPGIGWLILYSFMESGSARFVADQAAAKLFFSCQAG